MICPNCGTDNRSGVTSCVACGADLVSQPAPYVPNVPNIPNVPSIPNIPPAQGYPQNPQYPQYPQNPQYPQVSQYPMISSKNKVTAGILAILLGSFGVHKFYLGQAGMGVLYLLFCWTFIPSVVGVIEGIIYLTMSDQEFAMKYH